MLRWKSIFGRLLIMVGPRPLRSVVLLLSPGKLYTELLPLTGKRWNVIARRREEFPTASPSLHRSLVPR
jgi:hypothetical protein